MIDALRRRTAAQWQLLAHAGAAIPLLSILWHLLAEYSPDPVADLIHGSGRAALKLLIATLSVSPLIRWFRLSRALSARRTLGLWCFFYAASHITCWLVLDQGGEIRSALTELMMRRYLTIGLVAFAILVILASTSTQRAQRALKRRWQQIHNGIYIVAILVPFHYWMSLKSPQLPPLIYGAMLLLLLTLRWRKLRR